MSKMSWNEKNIAEHNMERQKYRFECSRVKNMQLGHVQWIMHAPEN